MGSQKNISAGKNVAGGNINETNVIMPLKVPSRIEDLIQRMQQDLSKDKEAAEFVDSLLSWMHPKKTKITRDLEKKLIDSGKTHLLSDALEAKERFSKQLAKTTFNPCIQEIYAHILADIQSHFTYRIKPSIATDNRTGIIEDKIADLIDKINTQLAGAPPALGIGSAEIAGMLYYLTGNCYIDWDYNDSLPPGN